MQDYKKLLQEINSPDLKLVGKGWQCLVFEYTKETIIKVYGTDIGKKNLQRLMKFYNSLDTTNVEFSTPEILSIRKIGSKLVVTEKKLQGTCLTTTVLKNMTETELKKTLNSYVEVLFNIQKIKTDLLDKAEPLDLKGKFFEVRKYSNWNNLLIYNLLNKYKESERIFGGKVDNAGLLVEGIIQTLREISLSSYRLIHGDYFPANLLVDDDLKVQAVLDFGILTTVGDPLFDIALGWTFSDMYDEIKIFSLKDYVGDIIKNRITKSSFRLLKLYVLIYSLISANMYETNDPNEGHFTWAIRNLNSPFYRSSID
ncbi:MAG: aminoglycoside phosphotransferase family protein [Patescibacteria group bacterium]|nr:aminoglycoside phosphotransferase family protein [Patescibacteria group bacterium]